MILGFLYLPTGGNFVAFIICLFAIAVLLLCWSVNSRDDYKKIHEEEKKLEEEEFERRVAEEVDKRLKEYGITKDKE
jgi:hypothetical protein